MWLLAVGLSERCVQYSDCTLSGIEGTHCTTHSERDPGDTAINCGACCFSFSTSCKKRLTVHWVCFAPAARNLKSNLMEAFYWVFGLRTVKSRFFASVGIWPFCGGWVYVTNTITHVQPYTLNSIDSSACNLHLSHYFIIHLSFVVESF